MTINKPLELVQVKEDCSLFSSSDSTSYPYTNDLPSELTTTNFYLELLEILKR